MHKTQIGYVDRRGPARRPPLGSLVPSLPPFGGAVEVRLILAALAVLLAASVCALVWDGFNDIEALAST